MHSFIHSFNHSFIYSFIHSFIHLFMGLFFYSLAAALDTHESQTNRTVLHARIDSAAPKHDFKQHGKHRITQTFFDDFSESSIF